MSITLMPLCFLPFSNPSFLNFLAHVFGINLKLDKKKESPSMRILLKNKPEHREHGAEYITRLNRNNTFLVLFFLVIFSLC